MADRASIIGLSNTSEVQINPATEEKQDAIIAALGKGISTDMEGLGKQVVGTTAVEVAFTGTTEAINIQADVANTGVIYIGKSDVTSAGLNAVAEIYAGDAADIAYDDGTNAVYVVASEAAQSVLIGALL